MKVILVLLDPPLQQLRLMLQWLLYPLSHFFSFTVLSSFSLTLVLVGDDVADFSSFLSAHSMAEYFSSLWQKNDRKLFCLFCELMPLKSLTKHKKNCKSIDVVFAISCTEQRHEH